MTHSPRDDLGHRSADVEVRHIAIRLDMRMQELLTCVSLVSVTDAQLDSVSLGRSETVDAGNKRPDFSLPSA